MKAIWYKEYEWRTDKLYDCVGCPECYAPALPDHKGKYFCPSCGKEVHVYDPEMLEWCEKVYERKTEYEDCKSCGGIKTLELDYGRNPVTMEWQELGGQCTKCNYIFIV